MSASEESKPVVLTCAQPTNQLTLGNYLGAIRNWAGLQDTHECFFGLVDLHAITVRQEPKQLRQSTLSCAAQYVACGLDPERSHIFVQSHVTGHTELAWVLACQTPIGDLQRMTQFKEKAAKLGFKVGEEQSDDLRFSHEGARQGAFLNSGLLFYPTLMAADILLYNADLVPTGEDQRQHLELCRDLARRFNHVYSETFKVPEPHMPKLGARIMSLQEPDKKMSKSDDNPNGSLFVLDSPKVLRKKVMSAVTDSESEVKAAPDKPGVSNLLTIYSSCTGKNLAEAEATFSGSGYGDFKAAVADAVVTLLEPVQDRYQALIEDRRRMDQILAEGAAVAQKRAYKMLSKVYRKTGFLERPR